jgi:hypothetical protein
VSTVLDILAAAATVAAWWTTLAVLVATAWSLHRHYEKRRSTR